MHDTINDNGKNVMIYLIEGLDRCGKSTFIDYLRNEIKNPKIMVLHSGKPPSGVNHYDWAFKHYSQLIVHALLLDSNGYDIIMDRGWLGETVYGPLYRGTSVPQYLIEEVIDKYQERFKLVLFLDSVENTLKRDDGLSLSVDPDKKEYEIVAFKTAYDATVIESKYMVDWSNIDFSEGLLKNFAAQFVNNGAIDVTCKGYQK